MIRTWKEVERGSAGCERDAGALLPAGKQLLAIVVHVWISRKATVLISRIARITCCVSLGAIAVIVLGSVAVSRVRVAVAVWIVIVWRLGSSDPLIRIRAQRGRPFDRICRRRGSDHHQHTNYSSRDGYKLPSHEEPPYCILRPPNQPDRGGSSDLPYRAAGSVATANDAVLGVRKESRQADRAMVRS